jgi:predicted NUDIX family phosphoesterase
MNQPAIKKEFILSYNVIALLTHLVGCVDLVPEEFGKATLFRYKGAHQNGLLAIADVLSGLTAAASFKRRHELETSQAEIHPIPYIVFQKESDAVWQYQRGKGVGEERLALDDSIAPGGHVDLADAVRGAPMVPYMLQFSMPAAAVNRDDASIIAIIAATIREMGEEVTLRPEHVHGGINLDDFNFGFELIGLLHDETNEVGSVHLGLVFRLRMPNDWVITSREAGIEARGFKLPEQLLQENEQGIIKLENWSKVVAQHLYNERSLKANNA